LSRYGIPIEHGNFQQMYIDTELFKKAGLDPDRPPKTLDDWLAAMKKLTVLDAKGEPTQVGFALRHKGHPVGITDNSCRSPTPSAHGCSRPTSRGDGLRQQRGDGLGAAVLFDLVNKHKVASIAFRRRRTPFGQKRAATIFASRGSSAG